MHWTRGLQQMCQLLEHHEDEGFARAAAQMPLLVAGAVEVDLKMHARNHKLSDCSLPRCEKDDVNLKNRFQVCTRCKVAKYCSRKCQAEHWNVHKRECKKPN